MTFADGRESICNLQAEMNFATGETKSTATFRILTKLTAAWGGCNSGEAVVEEREA